MAYREAKSGLYDLFAAEFHDSLVKFSIRYRSYSVRQSLKESISGTAKSDFLDAIYAILLVLFPCNWLIG